MAARKRTGPVTSDHLPVSQVVEKVMRTPGFKTVDDVALEEMSAPSEDLEAKDDDPFPNVTAIQGHPQSISATVKREDAEDYPYVVRFALLTHQDPEPMIEQAREEKAHKTSVTRKSTGWVRLDEVNRELRDQLESVTIVTI